MPVLEISRLGLVRAAAFGGFGLLLAWVGHASVAAYNVHEYPYNDVLNFRGLLGDMLALPLADVMSAARSSPAQLPGSNVLMIISVVLAMAAVVSRTVDTKLLIAASVVVVPYGLLGLLAFIGFVADGEWIAEGFSVMNAFAVWSIVLWSVTADQLRGQTTREQTFAAA